MAAAVRFLTSSQIQRLHLTWVSTALPSQPAMLDSAANSPVNIQHYEGQTDVFQLAANLSEKIMRNHAFNDGNKRTATVAADMFLKLNGFRLRLTPPQQEDAFNDVFANAQVAVVTNKMTSQQLGDYFHSIATKLDNTTPASK